VPELQFYEAQPRFRPARIKLWERMYGETFLRTEMSRMREFYEVKSKQRIEISGFVKGTSDRHFILLPTMITPQVYLQCSLTEGLPRPEDNSYVRIQGRSFWFDSSRSDKTVLDSMRVLVDAWKPDTSNIDKTKTDIGFEDFKNEIFTRMLNVEPHIRDLLAFQVVSCPPIEHSAGGIAVCLFDATHRSFSRRAIREIKRNIPSDLGKPYLLNTSMGRATLRYRFNFASVDADKLLSERTVEFLKRRTSPYDELSLSLGSMQEKPTSIEEPPCALSDLPTILNEDVQWVSRKLDPSIDALKYMIAMHNALPTMNTTPALLSVHEKMIELQDRYDIPSHQLARFKLLDASCRGRPESVLRLALADARTRASERVMSDDTNRMFHDYFLRNFDYLYDTWADLFTETVLASHHPRLSPDELRIMKIARKYERSRRRYATFDEIQQETALQPLVLERFLFDLTQTKGVMMEPIPRAYRVIPDV
jgi:hypothetical protein